MSAERQVLPPLCLGLADCHTHLSDGTGVEVRQTLSLALKRIS